MANAATNDPLLPPDVVAKIQSDNPTAELHGCPFDVGAAKQVVLVLKTPDRFAVLRYDDAIAKAKGAEGRALADERYVLDCLAYPDEATVRGYFEKRPLLSTLIVRARLTLWASGAIEADDQKL